MKTPEELAAKCAYDKSHNEAQYDVAYECFLAGYQAGAKRGTIETERRILNEYFDRYGADEHAKFAVAVNAYEVRDEE